MTKYEDFVSVDMHPPDIVYCALGLAGETGEVVDAIKKFTYHPTRRISTDEYREKILEELGDQHWYWTYARLFYGFTQEEIEEYNMKKLRARYPERHHDT